MQLSKMTLEERAYVRRFMAPRDLVLASTAIALLDDLESAELAKVEADKRCDAALAKLAAVDVLHEEDCHCFGECTCIYGRIRAILQRKPEGENA